MRHPLPQDLMVAMESLLCGQVRPDTLPLSLTTLGLVNLNCSTLIRWPNRTPLLLSTCSEQPAPFAKEKKIELNEQLFLTGYSEGGYTMMATTK